MRSPRGLPSAGVSKKGFSSVDTAVTVLVGNTATVNVILFIGQENQIVEARDSAAQVNTEQATVQGVLDALQIEKLPVNGRNFLDLAQLEPGVQIQDAANFGVGKDGYSSISFGGRFGCTARIEVDGIDVSDEIFGSTTTDIPASGIQEFQLSQSSLDLSTELTTSGAVNVTTRSGTNVIHGEAFGLFRDSSLAAALPAPPGLSEPFQRSQYGGRLGGPMIKNKFFYFLDAEHILQHDQAPVLVAPPSSNIRAASARHSMRRIWWRRRILSLPRRRAPSIASATSRTSSRRMEAWLFDVRRQERHPLTCGWL